MSTEAARTPSLAPTISAPQVKEEESSSSSSYLSWFNPCTLYGRITEHWREIVLIAGVALAIVCLVAVFFMKMSPLWAIPFGILGTLLLFAAYQVREIPTIRDMKKTVTTLKVENAQLKETQQKLEKQVDDLSTQNRLLEETRKKLVEDLSSQTRSLTENNEKLTQTNDQLIHTNASLELKVVQLQTSASTIQTTLQALQKESAGMGQNASAITESISTTLVKIQQETQASEKLCKEYAEIFTAEGYTISQEVGELKNLLQKVQQGHITNATMLQQLLDTQKTLKEIQIHIAEERTRLEMLQQATTQAADNLQARSSELRTETEALKTVRCQLSHVVNTATQHLFSKRSNPTDSAKTSEPYFKA